MGENIRIHVLTNTQKANISVMLSDPAYADGAKFEELIQNTLATASSRGVKVTITNRSALTPHYEVRLKGYGNAASAGEMNRMLEQSVMRDAAKKGYSLHSVTNAAGPGLFHRQIFLTN